MSELIDPLNLTMLPPRVVHYHGTTACNNDPACGFVATMLVQVLDRGFWVDLELSDDAEKVGRLIGKFPTRYRAVDPATREPLPVHDVTRLPLITDGPTGATITIDLTRWTPAMYDVLTALITAAES